MGVIAVGDFHQRAGFIPHGGEVQIRIVEHAKDTARRGADLTGQSQHFLLVVGADVGLLAQQLRPLVRRIGKR